MSFVTNTWNNANEAEIKSLEKLLKSRKGEGRKYTKIILNCLIDARSEYFCNIEKLDQAYEVNASNLDGWVQWCELKKKIPEISNHTLSRLLKEFENIGIVQKWGKKQEKGKPHVYYFYMGGFPNHFFESKEDLIYKIDILQKLYFEQRIKFDFAIQMLEEKGFKNPQNVLDEKYAAWYQEVGFRSVDGKKSHEN